MFLLVFVGSGSVSNDPDPTKTIENRLFIYEVEHFVTSIILTFYYLKGQFHEKSFSAEAL